MALPWWQHHKHCLGIIIIIIIIISPGLSHLYCLTCIVSPVTFIVSPELSHLDCLTWIVSPVLPHLGCLTLLSHLYCLTFIVSSVLSHLDCLTWSVSPGVFTLVISRGGFTFIVSRGLRWRNGSTLSSLWLLIEPVPVSVRRVVNPFAIERPHAPADLLYRQCSFRGFDKLTASGSSPFKRNLSLPVGARQPVVVTTSQQRPQQSQLSFCY